MKQTRFLDIPPTDFDMIEAVMRSSKPASFVRHDDVVYHRTVMFEGGMQMDIKVVNSEDGPWTEGVLFCGGIEVGCTEVGEEFGGEYCVHYQDIEFCTIVRRSEPALCLCPYCKGELTEIGSVGIIQNDDEWEAETTRFDCPNGHTVLICDTDYLTIEAICENCGIPCEYDSEMCLCDKCKEESRGTNSPTSEV